MTSWSCLTRTVFLLPAFLLTACVSTAPPASAPSATAGGRYELESDSPLLEPFDLARVRPVIPKAENRTLAGNKSPYTINGRTYRVMSSEAGYADTGFASWYGRKFHGHLTSNGEIYDMFQLSAAHTTLPIPSYIRVTNLDNGKNIIARVNDRGPFHDGRIVDLSYAGAVLLGYADKGTARVRVEAVLPGDVLPVPATQAVSRASPAIAAGSTARQPLASQQQESQQLESQQASQQASQQVVASNTVEAQVSERALIEADSGSEFLQVGAFASEDSARTLVSRLARMTALPVFIHSENNAEGALLHKVRIGPFAESLPVQDLIDSVQAQRLGTPFRVRVP